MIYLILGYTKISEFQNLVSLVELRDELKVSWESVEMWVKIHRSLQGRDKGGECLYVAGSETLPSSSSLSFSRVASDG